jgi:hypothetical protein
MVRTRGERLQFARKQLFKSTRLAAKALGVPFSTYWQHERAELEGGRDFGPNEAERYARHFEVTPEWLLVGLGLRPNGKKGERPKVPVVGYVGTGGQVHPFAIERDDLDKVDLPRAPMSTVALVIRNEDLGPYLNHWLALYNSVRRRASPDMIGKLCMVALEDGRILIGQIRRGPRDELFNFITSTGKTVESAAIVWAATIDAILAPKK